jgi:predicted AAA+ superfamily ATPase
MPKVYFYDTGLLCYLLGLSSEEELKTHYLVGSIFENFVIADIQKELMNRKSADRLYFFREKNGNEVDLLIKRRQTFIPIEIKKAASFSGDFTKGINYWNHLPHNEPVPLETPEPIIIYTGSEELSGNSYRLINWQNVNKTLW